MSSKLKVALCQMNSMIGDNRSNTKKIIEIYQNNDADLLVFPELCVSGYNCQDMFLSRDFCKEIFQLNREIIKQTTNKGIIFGSITECKDGIHNSAIMAVNREILAIHNKFLLPNYGVFNEKRYFVPGDSGNSTDIEFKGVKIKLMVCEDIWSDVSGGDCDLAIVINASPFSITKFQKRLSVTKKIKKNLIYVNAIGAQDHLVFDGKSFVMNKNGDVVTQLKSCEEDVQIANFDNVIEKENDILKDIYNAIILSIKEYSKYAKCGKFIIGLSGGIDSALVATLAADAVGAENLLCVMLPSEFSSKESLSDAINLVKNLGCEHKIIPISDIKNSVKNSLIEVCGQVEDDNIMSENIQPRIRMTILMAIANYQNRLLLCNGNKSENAMGYATLYGDMTGAFAPIIDLYKTQIYQLSRWRNEKISQVIPQKILIKEPSAELKPNQKDSDTLPEYNFLDKILYCLIEDKLSPQDTAKKLNIDESDVNKIHNTIIKTEFKRRQAPIGPKISDEMFTLERKYPICNC